MNGPSGFGKTMAATYCQNKFDGLCVECRSFFTAKNLMAALLREAGIVAAHRLADMHDQLIQELRLSRKPLFIDEVDHIAETKALQIIRDIHDAAQCAVILIGEEHLPKKLIRTERFHNRVLVWQPASAASERDAHQLARFYAPDIEIEDDLVKHLHKESKSIVRRICVNVDRVREFCRTHGLKKIGLKEWGDQPFYTDQPPPRRPA
jgi:DNA transposition AAA+ family ATPase